MADLIFNAQTIDQLWRVDPIPGKGVCLNVVTGNAGVALSVPFRTNPPQRLVVIPSLGLSSVTFFGLDNQAIVAFPLTNAYQWLPPFRPAQPILRIEFLSTTSTNIAIALWRYSR